MRSRTTTPILALAVAAVLSLAISSCSDDGSDDASDTSTTAPAADSLTGGQICSTLEPEALTEALGQTVGDGAAVPSGPPSCSYPVTGASTPGTVVVSAPRSKEELGGTTGSEAFDYYVNLAQTLGSNTGAEEASVDAGDQAVRFTGPTTHIGVVEAGGQIYTVTIGVDSAEPEQVDAVLVAMGNAFG